jgi:hypothetical protein
MVAFLFHKTQPWSYNFTTEIITNDDEKVVNKVRQFLPMEGLFLTSCLKLPENNDNTRSE